jgi:hypothetical protein
LVKENNMTTKTNPTRARKSIEERLEEMRARLEGLEKRKHEQEKRELHRLKLRLGSAALAAGFTADWTDAQLHRAMTAAVKTREGSVKPSLPKPEVESAKTLATAFEAPAAKPPTLTR